MKEFYVPMFHQPDERNNNWEPSICGVYPQEVQAIVEAARIKCRNPEYAVEVIVVRVRDAGIVEVQGTRQRGGMVYDAQAL